MPVRRIVLGLLFIALLGPAAVGQQLFFETPRLLREQDVRFPFIESVDDRLVLVFQERDPDEASTLRLRSMSSEDGREWDDHGSFGEPVSFSGSEPNIFSAAKTGDGRLFVALGVDERETVVYESDDGGESFNRVSELRTAETSVAPVISARDDHGLLLFINQDVEARQSIFVSTSDDGSSWSDFSRIEPEEDLSLSFAPDHASNASRDVVVFQGLEPGAGTGYQLYVTQSTDRGASWDEARRITTFPNPGSTEDPESYDNQRPFLYAADDDFLVTWERRFERESPRVFSARIDDEPAARDIIQVSPGLRSANAPRVFEFEGTLYYTWFEERGGLRQVVLAEPDRAQFRVRVLSDVDGDSTFAFPVVHRDRVHFVWQVSRDEENAIAYLEPDQSVEPPTIAASNFTPGSRAPRETAEVRIEPPDDPSGIAGYNYVWSRDPDAPVPEELEVEDEQASLRLDTDDDGSWFLRVIALDRAGNWSEPQTVEFVRDLTPPDPVVFEEPDTDPAGFLASNTFEINWTHENPDIIAGYTYTLSYIGPSTLASVNIDRLPDPPDRIMTRATSISRNNLDNGTWALRVAPVDDIGNIGEPETLILRLNKYVPVTIVSRIRSQLDLLGRTRLEIDGRGFREEGDVERIILDRDGEEPYDHVFTLEDNEFRIENDRTIVGPTVHAIRTGEYQVGIVHPVRGTYFAEQTLSLDATGVVKFGDFTIDYSPVVYPSTSGIALPAPMLVVWSTAGFMVLLAFFFMSRLVAVTREAGTLRYDIDALVNHKPLPDRARNRRLEQMKRRGIGLRLKFAAFFVGLVVSVVLLVAVPLGNFIINAQQQTLTDGLRERTNILLDSLVGGSIQLLPNAEDNLFELNALTLQTEAIPEALFATITGVTQGEELEEIVWASNDPRVTRAGDLPEDQRISDTDSLLRGETRYSDEITEDISELAEQIETRAREALGEIPDRIDQLNAERIDLAISGEPDAEEQVGEIDDTITELETEQREILNQVGDVVVSVPELSADTVLTADTTNYVFYKPIVFREIDGEVFFHGLVRVGVSSQRIIAEINAAQQNLMRTTGVIAVLAVAVGIVGALILASIIVIPISRLVRGVEIIRDTEDKADLADHTIQLKRHDELRTLAEAINQMTQGLVRAAIANRDLTVGKEVQKMFIPLRTDSAGRKLTTAEDQNEHVEFFGYYEGAKGVSGDYFNYRTLDDEHYALIKCDIAGKGVPAALIMVEVATIYLSYFRNWDPRMADQLPQLMESINDLIEERGFQGRFAAFTLSIINVRTGVARVCNAGDTVLHTYRRATGAVEETQLPPLPAAGVFSSDMLPNGFTQVKHTLDSGDILLMFTDGLEESKRTLRDESFRATVVGEGDEAVDNEEFTNDRIHDIVRCVQAGSVYRLERYSNPVPEELVFDFRGLEPTAENAVLALVAVEKIFRLVPDPSAGSDESVSVDVVVDEFLRKTFSAYDDYFRYPDNERSDSGYRRFTHIYEDDQYDDLTVLLVRKK